MEPLSIESPALVIDEAVALANIEAFQQHCTDAGLALRPHIKTHKTLHFANAQLKAGAAGITCQKISEAEVMAGAGHNDILITFNILGEKKLARLLDLAARVEKLTVTADNAPAIAGLSSTFKSSPHTLNVLIECDTGARRCGVTTIEGVLSLAQRTDDSPGLHFSGLMTYPAPGEPANEFMREAVSALAQRGLQCRTVSTGGTPDMWSAARHGVFTEYRIGTYIYNDRSLLQRQTCTEAQCAARIVATVVSVPTPDRAVIDAGSKALSSDLFGLTGYGHIVEHPHSRVDRLSEEHGVIEVADNDQFHVGEQISIIPNHVCVVSNLFDRVWLVKASGQLESLQIDARGCVT